MTYHISSGRSYPLGATITETGANFAIFSAHADKVELCLFDSSGQQEIARIQLPEFTDNVWHGHIQGIQPGDLYGYRVYGPFEPHKGHRFNPNKLLLDPYAKKLHGELIEHPCLYSYDSASPQQDLTFSHTDSAPYMPKCVVVDTRDLISETNQLNKPNIRRRDTIIYEMHVKGFSQLHPHVPEKLRGTLAGLCQPAIVEYLVELGVTSVELLPIHQFVDEPFLKHKGLTNYWGYNTLGFFLLEPKYLASGELSEFKQLVDVFHQHGFEVILDVVYNHTAEGNELGRTLSFRGIDNASYYRLQPQDQRFYENFSGCGNTLNTDHPRVIQLITDSLRYWVTTFGVDGFRFDLATILGRDQHGFNPLHPFFTVLRQDPILSQVKLIAEPWDIGPGGYQLGQFPPQWLEWNDRFRDTCRRFWRGDAAIAPDFAKRLHGSADIFEARSRRPCSSVNYICSHDGFTLHDLVSYEERHNEANGEENRDGHHSNFSMNFGVEGETANPTINQLRQRQKRNLLTTLFIAQGTPMLLAGDEMGNTQRGNNNAYCQDNEITWLSWQQPHHVQQVLFVQHLIQLRKQHPLLNRTLYQHGEHISSTTGLADIAWYNSDGTLMKDTDWQDPQLLCFAMLLAQTDADIEQQCLDCHNQDDALMVIFNAHPCEVLFQLPKQRGEWQLLLDTADRIFDEDPITGFSPKTITTEVCYVAAHSCQILTYKQQSQPTRENES
jgi:glycogen operon protein